MAKRRRRRRMRSTLGMPTKQDFEAMARILCRHNASSELTGAIAQHFGSQNPRFSESRFVAAARKC